MEISKSNDVPCTATALLHSPRPLGPSGDDSPALPHTSQPLLRHGKTKFNSFTMVTTHSTGYDTPAYRPDGGSVSPHTHTPPLGKSVTFELIISKDSQFHARLPLRVTIFPHDTTDSIVTTVRSFFGLYAPTGSPNVGISFEDVRANTLIARWDNFHDRDVIYVRVIEELGPLSPTHGGYVDDRVFPSAGLHMVPRAQQPHGEHISGPLSGVSRVRSPSPTGLRGRRITPTAISGKNSRSRSAKKSHSGSQDGYSSGDGAPASSSSRTKDHPHTTEISVENIVEGGRRKRAKFDSSVSTLFGVIALCLVVADSSSPGASSLCPAANARRHVHLVCLASSLR